LQFSTNKTKQKTKMINVKIVNSTTGIIKRIQIDPKISFKEFCDILTKLFGKFECLLWEDDEKDNVMLDSPDSFNIAKDTLTSKCLNFLKITMRTKGTKVYNCIFVNQEKTPSRLFVLAGSGLFTKKVTVKNCWRHPWSPNCTIQFVGGRNGGILADPSVNQNLFGKQIFPEEFATVTLTLTAPDEPGLYYGCWRFKSPDGHVFGPRITVLADVVVDIRAKNERPNHSAQRDIWAKEITQLGKLGFTDPQLNRQLLFRNDGDVAATVKELTTLPTCSENSRMKTDYLQTNFFTCKGEQKEEMQQRIDEAKAKSTPAEVTAALCELLTGLGFTDVDNNSKILTQTGNRLRKTLKILINQQSKK